MIEKIDINAKKIMYYSNVPKIFDLLKVFVQKPNLINKIYAKNNTYKIYSGQVGLYLHFVNR